MQAKGQDGYSKLLGDMLELILEARVLSNPPIKYNQFHISCQSIQTFDVWHEKLNID